MFPRISHDLESRNVIDHIDQPEISEKAPKISVGVG